MTIESDLLDRMSALVGRRDLSQAEYQSWAAGSATGGPNGNGTYPLTDATGFVRMVPSPAKVAQGGGGGGNALSSEWDADLQLTYGVQNGQSLSAAVQAFFDDDTKQSLYIPAGNYTCTWSVHTRPTSKRIKCGLGVRITQTAYPINAEDVATNLFRSPITVRQAPQWIERVTAQAVVSTVLGEAGAPNSTVMQLTIAGNRTVKKGQTVKVLADDRGEFFRDINGGSSILFGWYPQNGETITVAGIVYTFRTNATAAYDVQIVNQNQFSTATNFRNAVAANGQGGYGAGTVANPKVTATISSNRVTFQRTDPLSRAPVTLSTSNTQGFVVPFQGYANTDAEFAIIGRDSTDNVLTLSSRLNGNYASNVRVALMSEVTFEWEGGSFDQVPGITQANGAAVTNNSPYAAMVILNCVKPKVKSLKVTDGIGAGLQLVGCLSPHINDLLCRRLVNNTAKGLFGSGVTDVGCQGLELVNSTFIDVRHGITTGAYSAPLGMTSATTQIEQFGGARDGYVLNCKGFACSSAAFDTHEDVQGYTFDGCVVEKAYWGVEGGSVGFSSRGIDISYVNCTARSMDFGWWVNGSRRVVMRNCKGFNLRTAAIQFNLPGAAPLGPANNIAYGHSITDCEFEMVSGAPQFFQMSGINYQSMDVEMSRIRLTCVGTVFYIFQGSGHAVTAKDFTVDLYNWAAASTQFFSVFGDTFNPGVRTSLNLDGLSVTRSFSPSPVNLMAITDGQFNLSGVTARVTSINYVDNNTADGLAPRDWKTDGDLNRFGVLGTAPKIVASGVKRFDDGPISSASGTITPAQGQQIDVTHIADSEIFITLAPTTQAINTGDLPTENRTPGDKIFIFNNGGFDITTNGFVAPAGGTLRLVFTAGAWRAF